MRDIESEIKFIGLEGVEADDYRDKPHQIVRVLKLERDAFRDELATLRSELEDIRRELYSVRSDMVTRIFNVEKRARLASEGRS